MHSCMWNRLKKTKTGGLRPPLANIQLAMNQQHLLDFSLTRRAFLGRYAGSLGGLALAHMLAADQSPVAARDTSGLLAVRQPHHLPRACSVICLFQHGGPSQIDLFD